MTQADPAPDPATSPKLAGIRVLLAEDNITNQKVAVRMLRWLGCEPVVVADGVEVLEQLDQADFDIVLMDVQMPKLDGYQTTCVVRRRERGRGPVAHRLPIIAMTTHATQGDRERCLAAEMDDYLSKPVNITDLAAVLDRWVVRDDSDQPPEPVPELTAPLALNLDRLEDLAQGDIDFERELLNCLSAEVLSGIERLRSALEAHDLAQVTATLHATVGACRTVGAEALGSLARELEVRVRTDGLPPDQSWLTLIERERARLAVAIAARLDH